MIIVQNLVEPTIAASDELKLANRGDDFVHSTVELSHSPSPNFWVGVCRTVLKSLTLFQTKIYYFPEPFSDHLKRSLIALSNPATFRRGLFSFSICFEDECPWSMGSK